jgi:hypothetical protein
MKWRITKFEKDSYLKGQNILNNGGKDGLFLRLISSFLLKQRIVKKLLKLLNYPQLIITRAI